jgi:hypothetical protein
VYAGCVAYRRNRCMQGMWHIEGTGVCRVFLGKPEGMGPLGRPGLGWDDNIKMDLQEVGWGGGH